MKATDFLKQDHQTVRQLFKQYREFEGQDFSGKRDIFEQIRTELEVHAQIEEKLFYPACRNCGGEIVEKIDEGIDEHKMMEDVLGELLEVQADEEFMEKMTELIGCTEHHVQEEENELFPLVEEAMGAEALEELCNQMEAFKADLIAQDLGEAESTEETFVAEQAQLEAGSTYETGETRRSGEFGIERPGESDV